MAAQVGCQSSHLPWREQGSLDDQRPLSALEAGGRHGRQRRAQRGQHNPVQMHAPITRWRMSLAHHTLGRRAYSKLRAKNTSIAVLPSELSEPARMVQLKGTVVYFDARGERPCDRRRPCNPERPAIAATAAAAPVTAATDQPPLISRRAGKGGLSLPLTSRLHTQPRGRQSGSRWQPRVWSLRTSSWRLPTCQPR